MTKKELKSILIEQRQEYEKTLDTKLDKRFKENNIEIMRGVGVVFEQFRSEMKMGFEVLGGRIDKVENRLEGVELRLEGVENRLDSLEVKFDGLQEMVARNTEDIASLKVA